MSVLLRVYTSCCRRTAPRQCSPRTSRYLSSIQSSHIYDATNDNLHEHSFEGLGLHPSVLSKLKDAFPDVERPTATQKELILALSQSKDILLSDRTGSGKTFGLLLALWNRSIENEDTLEANTSTLVLTPHRDLALQCLHWLQRFNGTNHEDPSLVQVILRSASVPLTERIELLHSIQPRLVVGTPQGVLDILQADRSALPLPRFSTVVVDEADCMVEIIPRNAEKYEIVKFERNLKRHPSPTKQILDMIYRRNRGSPAAPRGPQLVMMSATLRKFQRDWLEKESGFFVKKAGHTVTIINGSSSSAVKNVSGPKEIVHHAIVVSPSGEAYNIKGAVDIPSSATEETEGPEEAEEAAEEGGMAFQPTLEDIDEFGDTPSPFNPSALEAIGVAFALDVPRVALLVLPASGAVRRAVFDLRSISVNAHGLDVLQPRRGGAYLHRSKNDLPDANPTLLVSTLASTRGLDLPDLTHVFILGIPSDRSPDTYTHMAGRVGRFGRPGKVISIVEARSETKVKMKTVVKDEPDWLRQMLRHLDITPVKFEHFD